MVGSALTTNFRGDAHGARGLRLFVLRPRSPKLNGHVERANRTHTEEFHEITPGASNSPT
jgi:hypothetical protein